MCFVIMNSIWIFLIISFMSSISITSGNALGLKLDLPFEHLPYYFNSYPHVERDCEQEPSCPYKPHLNKNVCWGYEDHCPLNPRSYSHPICDGDGGGWVATKDEQISTFYTQADFGYVKKYKNSIQSICKPDSKNQNLSRSSLECSEHLTFCRGRNIMIDFRDLAHRKTPIMYDTDVLKPGQIGGNCILDKKLLKKNLEFMSSLQSWGPEIQNFERLDKPLINDKNTICDQIITEPTMIIKIDATVNMYHHFCDFFNLYATYHVNSTSDNPDMFSNNNQIIIWRTYPYHSSFEIAFQAFTNKPILDLNHFKGKKVCFPNVIFPLLPRMIFGLFYNTPLIRGCRNSGLFEAFSRFMLHRLKVVQRTIPDEHKIKITFLSRMTKYRKVLNIDILLDVLRSDPDLVVNKVEFTHRTDFLEQLETIQDTDILIGIHGAGLTHLLFLPDWAVVFELYNCEDPNCYFDLSRLRGLKYLTWRDRNKLKYQDIKPDLNSTYFHKHANYLFDEDEFVSIVQEGIEHVKEQALILKQFSHDEL